MDLLPQEYKCLPRDWRAIYGLIGGIALAALLWFGLKWYYDKILDDLRQTDEAKLEQVRTEGSNLESEVSSLKEKLKKDSLDKDTIQKTNQQIDFFNKIYQHSFSWYEFLDRLENATPPNVWIKEIKIDFADALEDVIFSITCESKEPFDAPQFLKNIVAVREFVPAKGDTALTLSKVEKNKDGGHEFKLIFNFAPFKRVELEPNLDEIKLKRGEKKALRVVGLNLLKQKLALDPQNYVLEVEPEELGVFDKAEQEFKAGSASRSGKLILHSTNKNVSRDIRVVVD